jgi:hypothetical protein
MDASCDYGNIPSGFTKSGKFTELLGDYKLLEEDLASQSSLHRGVGFYYDKIIKLSSWYEIVHSI